MTMMVTTIERMNKSSFRYKFYSTISTSTAVQLNVEPIGRSVFF